jgi:Domain of unknown function (DUF4440)
MYVLDFASSANKVSTDLVHLSPLGNAIYEIANSRFGEWKDHSLSIYVRDGDTWKIRMVYVNYDPQERRAIEPEVRQQIEAIVAKFDEAYSQNDEAALAALHTQDAVEIRSWAGAHYMHTGRHAVATQYETDFTSFPTLVTKIGVIYPIGNDLFATMDLTFGSLKAHAAKILIREADTWKIGMAYLTGSSGT